MGSIEVKLRQQRGFPEADIVADAYASWLGQPEQFVHRGSSRGLDPRIALACSEYRRDLWRD